MSLALGLITAAGVGALLFGFLAQRRARQWGRRAHNERVKMVTMFDADTRPTILGRAQEYGRLESQAWRSARLAFRVAATLLTIAVLGWPLLVWSC